MLQVQLLFLLLIYASVKSEAVFKIGVTELPPIYQISHGIFDPFLYKVIHPPSFYLTNNKFEDFKYDPTQSTSFLSLNDQRKEETFNNKNILKSTTSAFPVSSKHKLPIYFKEVSPLPSYSAELDDTTQPISLITSVPGSTSPEDNTFKYVLDALFSNNRIISSSYDTSSEPVQLNPLSTLSILKQDNFKDINSNPIVTFPDSSTVLTTSAIPPISFISTFETPYPINDEEEAPSNLPPSTTLQTTTCDQDVCFAHNHHASEKSNLAIIVYPENYKSSFPINNDLLYPYINPLENLNYYSPTTYFEYFDTTTNPTDLSPVTSSTFLPVPLDTTLVRNIEDLVDFQKGSKSTPNPKVIIVYPEGYSYSNNENIQDAPVNLKRNDSLNAELTQSEHQDINASEINVTELTGTTPTISDELTTLAILVSNALSNPEAYSNSEPEFDNKAPNSLPTEGISINQNELSRSYDYETNSFRSNRMCKEQNAFLDVGGSYRFYVECQDYQPILKFCPGEYSFNLNIKWPEYPCKKLFDGEEDKVYGL